MEKIRIEPCPLCMGEHEVCEHSQIQQIDFEGVVIDVEYEYRTCPETCKEVYETEEQYKRNCKRYKLAKKESKSFLKRSKLNVRKKY